MNRHAGFSLTQEADDLLFGKPLLRVQSPSDGGLDSRPTCYSKRGGGRRGAKAFLRQAPKLSWGQVEIQGDKLDGPFAFFAQRCGRVHGCDA
jgi:hypothetical protein